MDIGRLFNRPDKLYAGVQYSHWNHKFGFKGAKEEIWQFLIKYYFSNNTPFNYSLKIDISARMIYIRSMKRQGLKK